MNVAGGSRAAIAVYHISTNVSTETDHNIVRRNFIRNSRNEGIYASEGATLRNNVVVDSQAYGINVGPRNTGGWGVFYGNFNIRHNTVYRVNANGGRALLVQDGAFIGPFNVGNNILVVTGGGQLAFRGPSGFTGTTAQNFVSGGTSGTGLGTVALADLSIFTSTTFGNANFLFPATGSAVDGAASAVHAAAADFNGTTRNAPADAGAYETSGAGNPGWTLSNGFKP